MGVRAVFIVVIAAWLAACASSEKYEAILNTWIGKSESRLVARWGPPDSVYVAPDGTRILTYDSVRQVITTGTPPTYRQKPDGTVVSTPGTEGEVFTARCKTSFTIVDDKIKSWRWEGNACRAE